jgi:hypothetical protein
MALMAAGSNPLPGMAQGNTLVFGVRHAVSSGPIVCDDVGCISGLKIHAAKPVKEPIRTFQRSDHSSDIPLGFS